MGQPMTETLAMFVSQMSVADDAIQLKERNVVGDSVLEVHPIAARLKRSRGSSA